MKFTILGCGSSMGVPRSDGSFGKCNPKNKKNYRTRCSALIKTQNETVLIDTSPDLRQQLIKNKIKKIDKVYYSHMHADQTHGINDLRVFYIKNKKTIPIFADKSTRSYLMSSFKYCFTNFNKEYPAILKLNLINENLKIKDGSNTIKVKPVKVKHGKVESICYIFDKKLAYISDVSEIYNKDFQYFKTQNTILTLIVISEHSYKLRKKYLIFRRKSLKPFDILNRNKFHMLSESLIVKCQFLQLDRISNANSFW